MNSRVVPAIAFLGMIVPCLAVAAPAIEPGVSVQIVEVAPDDAFAADRDLYKGILCQVGSSKISSDSSDWFGGELVCPDGTLTFKKVKLKALVASSHGVTVPSGTIAKISLVHPQDAYSGEASPPIEGKTCTANGDLSESDEKGFYSGAMVCTDSTEYYFYKVGFEVTGFDPNFVPPAPSYPTYGGYYGGEGGTGAVAYNNGDLVVVEDIGAGDLYISEKASFVGKSCTVNGGLYPSSDGYLQGGLDCPELGYRYFAYVKISDTRYKGLTIKKKTPVQIIDISDADALAGKKTLLKGKLCTAAKKLESSGDGWFSGHLKCDGVKIYFYQVALGLLK